MARRTRKNWKSIISALLVCALLIASVAGIAALFNRDTKTISPTAFSVGAVDATGEHVESDLSIYTRDLIACQGLTIEPDFEAHGTFQVFYYDAGKNFLTATDVMSASSGTYNMPSDLTLAKYCRIVITPDPTTEDGEEVTDFRIHFYEVYGYASDYTITVRKEQTSGVKNLFVADPELENMAFTLPDESSTPQAVARDGFGVTKQIDVTNMQSVAIVCEKGATYGVYEYVFVDADGEYVDMAGNGGGTDTLVLDVPEDAAGLICTYKLGHEFMIAKVS